MNTTEELQGALTALINTLLEAKDFVITEAPEVIQQLLLYKTMEYVFTIIVCTVIPFIVYRATFVWSNQEKDSWGNWSSGKFGIGLIGVILSPFTIVIVLKSALALLKILIAPKVWLLEYAASLV